MNISCEARVFDRLLLATGNRHKYDEFLELLPRHAVKNLIFAPELPMSNPPMAMSVNLRDVIPEIGAERLGQYGFHVSGADRGMVLEAAARQFQ